VNKAATKISVAKEKMREYRLFAKNKTKAGKDLMTAQVVTLIEGVQKHLGEALKLAEAGKQRLGKYARMATALWRRPDRDPPSGGFEIHSRGLTAAPR